MTLRSRLLSALLFLGGLLVVPLGLQYLDFRELQQAAVELAATPSESNADEILARRALEELSAIVRLAGKDLSEGGKPEPEPHYERLDRFLLAWNLFRQPDAANLAALPYAKEVLGDQDSGSADAWDRALSRISRHQGASWNEDPAALRRVLTEALEAAADGGPGARRAFGHLRDVATTFRARLLGVDAEKDQAENGVFEARVRGTSRVILEELVRRKQGEIFRTALLAAAGILLALYFARVLWNELIHPLQRLRGAMNNMAMSGSPSRVKVEGPAELKDVLGAYNRLIDTIAGESPAGAATGDACSRCNRETQKGDQYCPSCGFPLPAS